MYKIQIANQQRALRIDRQRLARVAQATLKSERVHSAEISVALVDDARIREINRRYLGHDYPTDVISFLLESSAPLRARPRVRKSAAARRRNAAPSAPFRGAGRKLSGEVIISAEMAVEMAAEYGWRPAQELSLYLVHGLLHLCGYDDLTSAEEGIMCAREIEVLRPWKIVPHYVA